MERAGNSFNLSGGVESQNRKVNVNVVNVRRRRVNGTVTEHSTDQPTIHPSTVETNS